MRTLRDDGCRLSGGAPRKRSYESNRCPISRETNLLNLEELSLVAGPAPAEGPLRPRHSGRQGGILLRFWSLLLAPRAGRTSVVGSSP